MTRHGPVRLLRRKRRTRQRLHRRPRRSPSRLCPFHREPWDVAVKRRNGQLWCVRSRSASGWASRSAPSPSRSSEPAPPVVVEDEAPPRAARRPDLVHPGDRDRGLRRRADARSSDLLESTPGRHGAPLRRSRASAPRSRSAARAPRRWRCSSTVCASTRRTAAASTCRRCPSACSSGSRCRAAVGSVQAGSGAIGGVVNLVTRRASAKPETRISGSGGSLRDLDRFAQPDRSGRSSRDPRRLRRVQDLRRLEVRAALGRHRRQPLDRAHQQPRRAPRGPAQTGGRRGRPRAHRAQRSPLPRQPRPAGARRSERRPAPRPERGRPPAAHAQRGAARAHACHADARARGARLPPLRTPALPRRLVGDAGRHRRPRHEPRRSGRPAGGPGPSRPRLGAVGRRGAATRRAVAAGPPTRPAATGGRGVPAERALAVRRAPADRAGAALRRERGLRRRVDSAGGPRRAPLVLARAARERRARLPRAGLRRALHRPRAGPWEHGPAAPRTPTSTTPADAFASVPSARCEPSWSRRRTSTRRSTTASSSSR